MRPRAGRSDSEVSAVRTQAQARGGASDGASVGVVNTSLDSSCGLDVSCFFVALSRVSGVVSLCVVCCLCCVVFVCDLATESRQKPRERSDLQVAGV